MSRKLSIEQFLVDKIDDQTVEESRATQRMVNALVNKKLQKSVGQTTTPRTRTRSKSADANAVVISSSAT